jgi:hypothetical protein
MLDRYIRVQHNADVGLAQAVYDEEANSFRVTYKYRPAAYNRSPASFHFGFDIAHLHWRL